MTRVIAMPLQHVLGLGHSKGQVKANTLTVCWQAWIPECGTILWWEPGALRFTKLRFSSDQGNISQQKTCSETLEQTASVWIPDLPLMRWWPWASHWNLLGLSSLSESWVRNTNCQDCCEEKIKTALNCLSHSKLSINFISFPLWEMNLVNSIVPGYSIHRKL